ncbi:very short patch repair endonuclease [Nocardia ninae]
MRTSPRDTGRWKDRLPPEQAYKRRIDAAVPAIEQDRAAGGRQRRTIVLGNGRLARASVSLRLYRRTRRVRAYLRWSQGGRTIERYICEVEHETRGKNLAAAWRRARERGLLTEAPLPPDSTASSKAVRASMQGNRSKNTTPELALRRLLHQRGLRYRVDSRPIPEFRRRADLVFHSDRVAVFVDGCFWHGCPDHYRSATRNEQFWREKIVGNQARDHETTGRLIEAGWAVVRVWEHEDVGKAANLIEQLLQERRAAQTRQQAAHTPNVPALRNQTRQEGDSVY